jgi:hypothetical protein
LVGLVDAAQDFLAATWISARNVRSPRQPKHRYRGRKKQKQNAGEQKPHGAQTHEESSSGRLTYCAEGVLFEFEHTNVKTPPSFDPGGAWLVFPKLAIAIGPHLPTAIPPSDEAKSVGGSRIAKNIGVIGRIDPGETARDHIPTLPAAAAVVVRCGCRTGDAENAHGGCDCNHDESLVSNHGDLLLDPS